MLHAPPATVAHASGTSVVLRCEISTRPVLVWGLHTFSHLIVTIPENVAILCWGLKRGSFLEVVLEDASGGVGNEKGKESQPNKGCCLTGYRRGQVLGARGPAWSIPWNYPPEECGGWSLSTILSCRVWGQGKAPGGEM